MLNNDCSNKWLEQIEAGRSINTSYYLPEDVAQEVIAIVGLAMRTGKTIQINLQDEALEQSVQHALSQQHVDIWQYESASQRIPLSTIIKWKAWLKTDFSSLQDSVPEQHPVLTYMEASHAPIYQQYSYSDLSKMMVPSSRVMQLSPVSISGDPEEYRLLRRTIRRMVQIWRPQYQALLALRLFGRAISTGEQRLNKLLQSWYNDLLDCLITLEDAVTEHDLTHATRLDQHPSIEDVLLRLNHLYTTINQSEVLAFTLEDTAHYIEAIRKYAIDVCSRLRLGLDIIASEEGFLHWLHNYHRLDTTSREIIDNLRLYPADQWASLLERWYFNEVLKKHDRGLARPTKADWADIWHHNLDIKGRAWKADQLTAAKRCKLALRKIISTDDALAHQLLRVEADHVSLTYGDIAQKHAALARDLWMIDAPVDTADITITDQSDLSPSLGIRYIVSRQAERVAIPILADHGLLTALPIARRLPVARALAYYLSTYAAHLNLLVLKGRLVISTLRPRLLAQRITRLGRVFIRESQISDPIADITDHLLASAVDIEIWIEGPLINNRKYKDSAQQYRLIQLLKSSGYTVLEIDDLERVDLADQSTADHIAYDLPDNNHLPKDLSRTNSK